jgi:hypothetical protein
MAELLRLTMRRVPPGSPTGKWRESPSKVEHGGTDAVRRFALQLDGTDVAEVGARELAVVGDRLDPAPGVPRGLDAARSTLITVSRRW